jgi:acyl carrier protein
MTPAQRELAGRIIAGLNLEDLRPEDLDPEAPLFGAGLGLDSIDALELAVIVDRHYGVKIPDLEAGRRAFASLAGLERFIAERRAACGS